MIHQNAQSVNMGIFIILQMTSVNKMQLIYNITTMIVAMNLYAKTVEQPIMNFVQLVQKKNA